MNEGRYLDIRIRLEACITQREAMIAENMDRSAKGQSMAYGDDAFNSVVGEFAQLANELRNIGFA